MTREEFEERMGFAVSDEVYVAFDAMYLAAGDINKDDFCKDLKEHKDSILLNEFYGQAERLKEKIDVERYKVTESADMLINCGHKYGDEDMCKMAIKMIGKKQYIKRCIKFGVYLSDADYDMIVELIN